MSTTPLPLTPGEITIPDLDIKLIDNLYRQIPVSPTNENRKERFEKSWKILNAIYTKYYQMNHSGSTDKEWKMIKEFYLQTKFEDAFKETAMLYNATRKIKLPIYKSRKNPLDAKVEVISTGFTGEKKVSELIFKEFILLNYELRNRITHLDIREDDIKITEFLYFSDVFVEFIKIILRDKIDTSVVA